MKWEHNQATYETKEETNVKFTPQESQGSELYLFVKSLSKLSSEVFLQQLSHCFPELRPFTK